MRKIRITESQLKTILESELGYPLDLRSGPVTKDNTAGVEVTSDPLDVDVDTDSQYGIATTTDNISKKKNRPEQFGIRTARVAGGYRLEEGRELDNMQSSGLGKKSDAQIAQAASNGGGKMVNNLNNEIESNRRGVKMGTQYVRDMRLKDQKKNDPVTFAKNGGDATLKAIENNISANSSKHKANKAEEETTVTPTPSTSGTNKKKSSEPTVYYFK